MAGTLSQLATNTATATVRIDDVTVNIEYYPRRITTKVMLQLNAMTQVNAENMNEHFSKLIKMLVTLIKSWDLYEDDAHTVMVPIDEQRLAELPFDFFTMVVTAITGGNRNPEVPAPRMLN